MKSILFVTGTLSKGGAERVALKICHHLVKKGFKVYIACLLSAKQEYDISDEITVFDISEEKRNLSSLFKWVKKLKKIIKEINPYRIISFAGRVNIVTLLASKRNTVIVSERNDPRFDKRGKLSLLACKYLYATKAKVTVFQTKEVQELFSKKIINKSVIIKNPISIPKAIKTSYDDSKRIIMVGRLAEQKNYFEAIKAFKNVSNNRDIELHIYGQGPLEKDLVDFTKSFNVDNKVSFCGLTDTPDKEMIDSSIFLLSSKYEGLSNSLMEAMSLGLPVISTPVAGSNELIENGFNGVLLNGFDSNEIERGLRLLIESKDLREYVGKNARESLKKCYEPSILEEWMKIVEKE